MTALFLNINKRGDNMIGKAIGKVFNTAQNIVLGVATSKPVEKVVKTGAKAIGNAVEPGAGILNKGLQGGKALVEKATDVDTYKAIGKATQEMSGKVVKNVVTDPDAYKQIGSSHTVVANKSLFGDEMKRRIQGGLDTVAHVARGDSWLTGKRALVKTGGDNLLPMGLTATKTGIGLAATAQLMAGTPQAVEQWNKNRQGSNYDSQPVTSAPSVPAYANNGGATGDLVFALNNLRRGGMM